MSELGRTKIWIKCPACQSCISVKLFEKESFLPEKNYTGFNLVPKVINCKSCNHQIFFNIVNLSKD